VHEAPETVSQARTPLTASQTSTWSPARSGDAGAVWHPSWDQHEPVVCRRSHPERTVSLPEQHGTWMHGILAQAYHQGPPRARGQGTVPPVGCG
jgi:hypothetical protein